MSRLEKIMDRYFTVVVISVVGLFCTWAIVTAVSSGEDQVVLTFTRQRIERIERDGTVTVPLIDGYNGAAVCLGDTVPVRGSMTVEGDKPLPVSGTLVWSAVPPGPRFTILSDNPRLLNPGTEDLIYENIIPPEVVERTLASGEASQWRLQGKVTTLAPDTLDTAWETARFWVVDCDG